MFAGTRMIRTPAPHRRSRVLVVDDHADNRELLTRRLNRRGVETVAVSSGEEALASLGGCDAVLLDIEMPGMSGLECLRRIRAIHPLDELPVLMVTARDRSEDVVESLRAGACDYVTKPIDMPVLFARLGTWLRLKELRDTREHFMRIASHDLRNPLSRILSTVEIVQERVPPGTPMPPRMHALLGGAGEAVLRMARIIDDFVDLQALDEGGLVLRHEKVEIDALLEAARDRHAAAASAKGIALQLGPVMPITAPGDPARLDQVIDNLVDNAVKFSGRDSTVTLACAAEGDGVLVEVRDEGPGLSPADLERVFQRYARLSARPTAGEPSSGLGLSIAREIVERHAGSIGARPNTPSPGATFWVRLPIDPTA